MSACFKSNHHRYPKKFRPKHDPLTREIFRVASAFNRHLVASPSIEAARRFLAICGPRWDEVDYATSLPPDPES